MTATELYKAGKLQEALEAQLAEVKANPADPSRRLFLFELAAFSGDLDRAKRQIDAVKYDNVELDTAVARYGLLVAAETKRRRLFTEGLKPRFLVDPPEHVQLRLDAVNRLREKNFPEAHALLSRANEGATAIKGTINGKAFQDLRDADDLFGLVLEVMAHGEYFWVPFDQLDTLVMKEPKYPRDLHWVPARLIMRAGEQGEVFLPALYPQSHEHPDDQIKLGRASDWVQEEGGPVLGRGLRTFLVGEDGMSLLEWREVQLTA